MTVTSEAIVAIIGAVTTLVLGVLGATFKFLTDRQKAKAEGAPAVTTEDVAREHIAREADRLGIAVTAEQWAQMFAAQAAQHAADMDRLRAELEARIVALEDALTEDRQWIRTVIPWATVNSYRLPVPPPSWYGTPTKEHP